MRVPLSWLREYVAVDASADELAARLTISTCEVERIERRGVPDADGNLGLYLVGRVLEVGKHPNADRLQLCRVDVGEREPRQIVCGAWNFGTGATVAVALPGAILPGGVRLEQTKLRGEISAGMILSERELEIGQDERGILVLEEGLEPGAPLGQVLPLVEEVLELEITPNRPDLLSVYGIAREVAALFDAELQPLPRHEPNAANDEQLQIRIEDEHGCPRYLGRLFREVGIAPSPPWLKARLTAAGMRSISNVVDVTNYVMLAVGNPLHAFDRTKLAEGRIVVRRARSGEEIVTLDGATRRLEASDLVIADAERPVAIAGIMGSAASEVDEATSEVLLEAANFEPVGVLRTSERLGLRTESSGRWEKGVDAQLAGEAALLATKLLVELTGGRWVGQLDAHGDLPQPPLIHLRPPRTSALIGLEISEQEQLKTLRRLGFEGGAGEVVVPSWRARDVTREIDLIEEIARFRLAEVPFTLPLRRAMFGRLSKEQRLRRAVEDVLVGAGLSEAYTPSLVAEEDHAGALRLPIPLSAEQAFLRTTLLAGLVEAAQRNVAAGSEDVALFEIARVYLPPAAPRPSEHWRLGAILEGGFSAAKGIVEAVHELLALEPTFVRVSEPFLHPGKAARVEAGWLGELHPARLEGGWGALELDLQTLFRHVPDRVEYEDVISFPALKQDLAFVVDESVEAGALVAAAHEAAGPELREMRVFDVYRGGQVGKGRKSVAFRVEFQSPERTLSDEDAASLRGEIVRRLGERFGAELRA